jgi:hypothetical protein
MARERSECVSALAASLTVPPRLWNVPVYLPYLQPALTDLMLQDAEAQLGVRLPGAYVAALRIQNGGYLRLTDHPAGFARVKSIAGIGPRFPSILEHDWTELKEYMVQEDITTPRRIDDLIPFCGDGHFHYCFDYRRSGRMEEPCVTYIDVECFDADEMLAADFGTFLHQLKPKMETAYGLITHDPAEIVAAAVSEATGLLMEDRGEEWNGYRLFRAALPGGGSAWLSANRTRHGFVRKRDPEFEVLSGLLPDVVARYPEHADCGYFLNCQSECGADFESDAGRTVVRDLTKLPFLSRALLLEG